MIQSVPLGHNDHSPKIISLIISGIFTAQTEGLYFFSQYWLTSSGYSQYLAIRKNGAEQCESYGDSGNNFSPSCSVVLELIKGDRVYVTSGDGDQVFCTDCAGFAGFLIQAYN